MVGNVSKCLINLKKKLIFKSGTTSVSYVESHNPLITNLKFWFVINTNGDIEYRFSEIFNSPVCLVHVQNLHNRHVPRVWLFKRLLVQFINTSLLFL